MGRVPGRCGLFALVLYSGFAGAQVTQANFSVTFIYVIFWVGLPVASVLFGDVFRALSPWRTSARLVWALVRVLRRGRACTPPLRYPSRLGCGRRSPASSASRGSS